MRGVSRLDEMYRAADRAAQDRLHHQAAAILESILELDPDSATAREALTKAKARFRARRWAMASGLLFLAAFSCASVAFLAGLPSTLPRTYIGLSSPWWSAAAVCLLVAALLWSRYYNLTLPFRVQPPRGRS
jgi:hypothetical protein